MYELWLFWGDFSICHFKEVKAQANIYTSSYASIGHVKQSIGRKVEEIGLANPELGDRPS